MTNACSIILLSISLCTCSCFSETFGIQSVFITDSTGGRVCLECSFNSFSTDTECTVELVSSCVQYTGTINRSGNDTAKGCVSGVTEGEYDVRVYDQSSSELVYEVKDVTVVLSLTATTTSIMSPFSTTSVTLTITLSSEIQSEYRL